MPLRSGSLITNRYRVLRLLGEGGFGAVYLAEDTRLGNKCVALKESFDNSTEARTQFQLEAQLLAKLEHVCLPRVTDNFIEADGRQFLVMDFVEGDDLHERVIKTGHPLDEREAVSIMVQVCKAVAYLHTRKPQPVIHRDIKPPNIKITREGRAVLVDFGIAKVYNPRKGTAKVAKAFSPHFSPPEQYIGKTDTRSDVYALGATLYCLVCAVLPPDSMERLTKGVSVRAPSKINPTISPALEHIILQALELNPDKRFLNANHLAAALCMFQSGNMENGAICPRCGWQNRPGSRFCTRDGTPLQPTKPISEPAPSQGALASIPPAMQFEVANAFARNEDWLPAIAAYHACLEASFRDAAVYHNLGICYRLAGQAAEAIALLSKGIASYPKDADLHQQMAVAYLELKQEGQALKYITRACQLAPNNVEIAFLHGQLLFDLGKNTDAIHELKRVVQLTPDSAPAHFWLGRALGNSGNLKAAAHALERAASLEKQNAEPYLWLGLFNLRTKKLSEARVYFQKVLQRDPNHAWGHYELGEIAVLEERYTQALSFIQKAIMLDGQVAQFHTGLGLCMALLNQKHEAILALQNALNLDPQTQTARELLQKL